MLEFDWMGAAAQDGSGMNSWVVNMIARWVHVTAGITWIGLLYFFNFINGSFQAKLDADTKRKVVPELMPRALFWFRWGAAFTWITGVILFLVVYWGQAVMYADGAPGSGMSNRSIWIIAGALFGTVMAFNVWFIIWPAQKQIIPKVRDGEAPDPALAKRATLASKVNTYLSVPLLMTMVSNSIPSLFTYEIAGSNHLVLGIVVVVGLLFVKLWYMMAPKVQGM